ncbi:MAG: PAS domain S-box protein [Verrucomicrobia bacterium]|nr:PAS domain S-box protein [Verrucomicrobiota bacterium]
MIVRSRYRLSREALRNNMSPAGERSQKSANFASGFEGLLLRGQAGSSVSEVIRKILLEVRECLGYDFFAYNPDASLRRVKGRMDVRQVKRPLDYLDLIRKDPHELELLYHELLGPATSFFRDPQVFQALVSIIEKDILPNRRDDTPVRIWIPGCATGEEAYSIAILMQEVAERSEKQPRFQIFATDVNPRAIDVARTALYTDAIAADVSSERLARFFTRQSKFFRVSREIRERVTFARQDLILDPPLSKIDLLSCRNLVADFDRVWQNRMVSLFHYALKSHGFLVLGPAEEIDNLSQHFAVVDYGERIFRRLDLVHIKRGGAVSEIGLTIRSIGTAKLRGEIVAQTRALHESEARTRVILDLVAEAVITITEDGQIESMNPAAIKMFGYTSNELIGRQITALMASSGQVDDGHSISEKGISGIGHRLEGKNKAGDVFPLEVTLAEIQTDGQRKFAVCIHDISIRARAELEMRAMRQQENSVSELSQHALEGRDLGSLFDEATAKVINVLKVDLCDVLELIPPGDVLQFRSGAGAKAGWIGRTILAPNDYQEGFTLLSNVPVVVEDWRAELRFRASELLVDHDIRSGASVKIQRRSQGFGLLGAYSKTPRKFSDYEIRFLASIANVLAMAVERRDLENELVNISSREQLRIGHDLHDGLCQQLAGIQFTAELVAKRLPVSSRHKEELAQLAERTREAIGEARNLASGLSLVSLQSQGLVPALQELTVCVEDSFGIRCFLECERSFQMKESTRASHVYRIVQEAVHNAVKHGKAKTIIVRLAVDANRATLSVIDNGMGLKPDWEKTGGMGLRIMKYRAGIIDGTFSITSIEPRGTRVVCTFNYEGCEQD